MSDKSDRCQKCGAERNLYSSVAPYVYACHSWSGRPDGLDYESADCLRRQLVAAQQANTEQEEIVKLACEWHAKFRHGRDICDEGYSIPDYDAQDALYDAVENYKAARKEPT